MRLRWISLILCFAAFSSRAAADDLRQSLADTLKKVVHTNEPPSYRDNFRLISSDVRAWTISENFDRKYVVLVAWLPGCACSERVLRWYGEVAQRAGDGVAQVLFLDPSEAQDRDVAERARAAAGTPFPVLMDFSQTITASFDLHGAGDFAVIDTATGKTVFRGRAFDGGLASFLGAKLPWFSGTRLRQLVGRTQAALENCAYLHREMGPREQRRALSAFGRVCLKCHMLNPSVDSYRSLRELRGWHEMNRLVMRLYRMPPGGVDTDSEYCLAPKFPVFMDTKDLGLVQRWIEAGEPVDGSGEALDPIVALRKELEKENHAEAKAWNKRKADLVLPAPVTDTIPPNGSIRYVYQLLGGPLKEDLYVKGAYLEANTNVLHHAVLYAAPSKPKLDASGRVIWEAKMDRYRIWSKYWEWNAFSLQQSAWPGTVYLIPKGSYLVLQQHYDPNGARATNRSRVSFVLDREPGAKIVDTKFNFDRADFHIPPHERHFELVKTHTIDRDASLVAASAHGHFRFSRYYFLLKYPGGETRRLCNVPFHQVQYEVLFLLRRPIFVPQGTEVEAHLIYDNSAGNSLNPHPGEWVANGDFYEHDEMDVARVVDAPGRIPNAIDLRDRPAKR